MRKRETLTSKVIMSSLLNGCPVFVRYDLTSSGFLVSVSAAASLTQSGLRHSSSYPVIVFVPALPTQGLPSTSTNSVEESHIA